jgi:hypothetical protein
MVEAERRENDNLLPRHAHYVLQQALALRPPKMLDEVQGNDGIDRAIGDQRQHSLPSGIEEDEARIVGNLFAEFLDVRLERFDADVRYGRKNRLWANTRADVQHNACVLEIWADRVARVSVGARDPLDLAADGFWLAVGFRPPETD